MLRWCLVFLILLCWVLAAAPCTANVLTVSVGCCWPSNCQVGMNTVRVQTKWHDGKAYDKTQRTSKQQFCKRTYTVFDPVPERRDAKVTTCNTKNGKCSVNYVWTGDSWWWPHNHNEFNARGYCGGVCLY